MMDGLTAGRIVHWVGNASWPQYESKHVAAIVIDVLDVQAGEVALHLFAPDGCYLPAVTASYSEGKEPGTWHWIER